MLAVTIAVEGATDEAVVQKLLEWLGIELAAVHGRRGKRYLDRQLAGFNNAARFAPWLVVRDLDQDAPCAGELVHRLLPHPAEGMTFRVSVRAIESWLLGDRERIASFLGISRAKIPLRPDDEQNPKQTLVNLARQSHRRAIREDFVPASGLSSTVGPGYSFRIQEFADQHWRPATAATKSESLRRCIEALKQARERAAPQC